MRKWIAAVDDSDLRLSVATLLEKRRVAEVARAAELWRGHYQLGSNAPSARCMLSPLSLPIKPQEVLSRRVREYQTTKSGLTSVRGTTSISRFMARLMAT